ncbi:hypothetical protein DFP72DRAFT_505651 [Ephemerocybe angulata]|uniref:Uncharacterized protein n=1 Tax=Ephemerocybe angulata TaxID=980116 RepID=A0A8H6HS59_9AGAR|nr:hypothetical protein DFP72DRAFT_505651 [Tulosesus angulatus]
MHIWAFLIASLAFFFHNLSSSPSLPSLSGIVSSFRWGPSPWALHPLPTFGIPLDLPGRLSGVDAEEKVCAGRDGGAAPASAFSSARVSASTAISQRTYLLAGGHTRDGPLGEWLNEVVQARQAAREGAKVLFKALEFFAGMKVPNRVGAWRWGCFALCVVSFLAVHVIRLWLARKPPQTRRTPYPSNDQATHWDDGAYRFLGDDALAVQHLALSPHGVFMENSWKCFAGHKSYTLQTHAGKPLLKFNVPVDFKVELVEGSVYVNPNPYWADRPPRRLAIGSGDVNAWTPSEFDKWLRNFGSPKDGTGPRYDLGLVMAEARTILEYASFTQPVRWDGGYAVSGKVCATHRRRRGGPAS